MFRSKTGRARDRTARLVRGRGFTLLETLVVMAIAAVLATASFPRAAGLLRDLELRGAVVQLGGAIVRGRTAALREGRTWALVAHGRSFSLGPLGEEGARESLPGRVAISAATSGGEVRFSPTGIAENATFTLALDAVERRVVVNQRGRVTLE
jgi:prepilin-type N-terminal cleavage/methylation domain-containing protein